jgi:YycH protein.
MKADGIQIPELPESPPEENYLEAQSKRFTRAEMAPQTEMGQKISIVDQTTVFGQLDVPYPLGDEPEVADVDKFVTENLFNGGQYRYWDYDEEAGTITYFQTYRGKMIFQNKNGKITLHLNEAGSIGSYTQTMLENIQEVKKQNILTANQALVVLYNKRLIRSGNEITGVDFGYYTLVPAASSQLLVPTWRFAIDGEKNYYVNAVEGQVFQENESESQMIE